MTGNVTLYANWKQGIFTVTFDPNGGEVTPESADTDETGKLADLPEPTKEGCTFGGWYTGPDYAEAWDVGNVVTENMTLYAKWVYTVTLDPGDGTVTPGSVTTDAAGKLTALPEPERDGYTFDGWYTASDGGAEVTASDTFTANTTLYAHWTQNTATDAPYTITLDANGGTVSSEPVTTDETGKLDMDKLPTPEREGYTFDGWFTASDGGTKVDGDYEFTAGTKIYAHWTQNTATDTPYTITLDANGGTVSPEPVATDETGKLDMDKLPTPEREGFTFDGWWTASDGGAKVDGTYEFTAGTKIYAHWTQNTAANDDYTVTFDTRVAGITVAAQTVAEGGKVTKPAAPSRAGYKFNGWYIDAACTTPWDFDNDTVTGDMTLYAGWVKNNTSSGGSGGGGSYSPTIYPVNVPGSVPNGTVSVSPRNASPGTTVTITVTPDEGYEISAVAVTDKDGKKISVTDNGNGRYIFIMPAREVIIGVSFAKIGGNYAGCPRDYTCPIWTYTDASTTAWYHDGVHYCIENGLMSGYSGYIFRPDGDTTRAMIATILWRLEGSPVMGNSKSGTFIDVPDNQWYTDAVEWAAASGAVGGYGNGKFGPDDPITREQLAAMLYRYEQYKGGSFTGAWMFPLNYTDAELVSSWAYEPMCWATMNGIMNGVGNGRLDPNGKATRAQVATMIMRFCESQ